MNNSVEYLSYSLFLTASPHFGAFFLLHLFIFYIIILQKLVGDDWQGEGSSAVLHESDLGGPYTVPIPHPNVYEDLKQQKLKNRNKDA